MPSVTFQVLEGIDKGRIFRELPTPVTIGREEGNILRLNDERVSRFHAKIQIDNNDIILTDLDSTNGTRVNGNAVQIRRLRPGDRVSIGRSLLLFGSNEEIASRIASLEAARAVPGSTEALKTQPLAAAKDPTISQDVDFDVIPQSELTLSDSGTFYLGPKPLPALPQKLSPAQVARLAEILDFLHGGLSVATENAVVNEEVSEVVLTFANWQKVLGVQMLLARYLRAVAEPGAEEA